MRSRLVGASVRGKNFRLEAAIAARALARRLSSARTARKGLVAVTVRPACESAKDAAVGRPSQLPQPRVVSKRPRTARVIAATRRNSSPRLHHAQVRRFLAEPVYCQQPGHVYAPPASIIPKESGRVEREARLFRHRHAAASRSQPCLCLYRHAVEQYWSTTETAYVLVAELARFQRRL